MKIIIALVISICFLTVCYGNEETLVYLKVQYASELAGTTIDQVGAPIPEVRVSELSEDWKELRSTTTDSHGHWSLTPSENGKTYRIQFSKYAFRKVQIRVKVTKHHAKPLTITIPVA